MIQHFWVFAVLAFISSLVAGISGFGTGLILLSLGSLFFDTKDTIVLANIFFIGVTLSRSVIGFRAIDWRMTRYMFVLGVPMIIVGATMFIPVSERFISGTLGVTVCLYVIHCIYPLVPSFAPSRRQLVLAGGIWGVLGGFIGDGNAVKAAVFDHVGMRKEEFVATMAFTSLIANILKCPVYQSAAIASVTIGMVFFLLLLALIGSAVSQYILAKMKDETVRRIMLVFLTFAGVKLMFFG